MSDKTKTSATVPVRYAAPTELVTTYTEQDQQALISIYEWLNRNADVKKEWLATATGYPSGTVASVLSGKYAARPTTQLKAMQDAIARRDERRAKGIDDDTFAETTLYRLAISVCNRARTYRNFGVLSAYVGTGKTTALKRYTHDNPGTILVEADPDMTSGALLSEIMEQAGITPVGNARNDKYRAIVRALKGSDRLIILDEAEKVNIGDKRNNPLEYLRRIRDKAGIGVVLAGTERLHALITPEGAFGQIRSRAPFVPPVESSITRDDAVLLIGNTLPQADEDTIKALWSLCRGSARMLCEGIIPTVKDYGIGQGHDLTAAMVLALAKKAMSLTPARGV